MTATPQLRILVTGSRNWADRNTIRAALVTAAYPWLSAHNTSTCHVTVVHGGARRADTIAGEIGRALGFTVEVHHADWERYGKRAGMIRNQVMVDAGADVCLAFPLGESRGTRGCMRAAEKAGIPVHVYEPIGGAA
jgi:hypothetical protein